MERLQEVVPFDIILPKYLPEDLAKYYPIFQYSKDHYLPGDIIVNVYYWTLEAPHRINYNIFISPSLKDFLTPPKDDPYNYLNFSDTKVLEETWMETVSIETQEKQLISIYNLYIFMATVKMKHGR